ncbi:hypothetical protein P8605_40360 [Streptomyces sp. T-3]|nr:hypothetical protein [Streptomyces sp. T-3]
MLRSPLPSLLPAARAHLSRVRRAMRQDAGYTTETIVVTALLVILALAVIGVIATKVLSKANGIDLGG